jgi:anti-sigma factor RsiW
MHTQWTDQLSEYLDGELPSDERDHLERHLAECAACAHVLEDLKAVVATASGLGELPPPQDLWPAIQERIQRTPLGPRIHGVQLHRRRLRLSVPELIAASVALVTISGGTAWMFMSREAAAPVAEFAPAGGGVSTVAAEPGHFGETSIAIAQLERTLAESRARLDPETLEVIEHNLGLINAAISEVERALAEDPGSMYLNLHMADTMRRKLELLQDIGALAAQSQ